MGHPLESRAKVPRPNTGSTPFGQWTRIPSRGDRPPKSPTQCTLCMEHPVITGQYPPTYNGRSIGIRRRAARAASVLGITLRTMSRRTKPSRMGMVGRGERNGRARSVHDTVEPQCRHRGQAATTLCIDPNHTPWPSELAWATVQLGLAMRVVAAHALCSARRTPERPFDRLAATEQPAHHGLGAADETPPVQPHRLLTSGPLMGSYLVGVMQTDMWMMRCYGGRDRDPIDEPTTSIERRAHSTNLLAAYDLLQPLWSFIVPSMTPTLITGTGLRRPAIAPRTLQTISTVAPSQMSG